MDPTLVEISMHALDTVARIERDTHASPDAKLNMIFNASGIFVAVQRSLYRAHDKLYKIEQNLTER